MVSIAAIDHSDIVKALDALAKALESIENIPALESIENISRTLTEYHECRELSSVRLSKCALTLGFLSSSRLGLTRVTLA